jgi:hypothetical protein
MAKFHHRFFDNGMNIAAALAVLLATSLSGCVTGTDSAQNAALPRIPGAGVTVYAAGDIADCRNFKPADSGAAQTARLIMDGLAKDGSAAVLALGDNTYPSGRPTEFTSCYEPTWGRFKARTYSAPGNHEYYTQGATGYYGYFGDAAGPARRGYFSFNLGKWHVISLNSNLKQAAEHLAQLEWLKTELDQHKTRCTLAYWHHPVYSSGGHGDSVQMQDIWQVLAAAGADVVLVAHDHDYERFAPQGENGQLDKMHGIRQFVVGTGGAKLTSFRRRRPNSEVGDNSTHGVLKLVLKETGYEWEFLPVTQDGFTDRGMALCH